MGFFNCSDVRAFLIGDYDDGKCYIGAVVSVILACCCVVALGSVVLFVCGMLICPP